MKGRYCLETGSKNRIEDPVWADSIGKISRAATLLAIHGSYVKVVDTANNELLFLVYNGNVKVDRLP